MRVSWSFRFSKATTTNFVRAMSRSDFFSEMFVPACPVKLLKRYLVHCSIPSSSRDLIFSSMSRGNNSIKLVSQDEPISCITIREAFRKDLRSVGVDSSTFGFYSLRSRGATSAAYNGVSDSVFQWLGRWRSVLAKDAYRWWPRQKAFSFQVSWALGTFICQFAQYFVTLRTL